MELNIFFSLTNGSKKKINFVLFLEVNWPFGTFIDNKSENIELF